VNTGRKKMAGKNGREIGSDECDDPIGEWMYI
jgi:hypothetical protein